MELALAILLYPGLALAVALALLFGWLAQGRAAFGRVRPMMFWRSADGLAAVASMLLAALALVLLPWPLHPASGLSGMGNPVALWATTEAAFLVALLPGLLAPAALGARAASREGQLGIAGRFVIWMALGVALWSGAGWAWVAAPGRALAAVAGLLALPAAIGMGPFAAERSLSAAGAEEGLDEATAGLVRFARTLRGAALLAAVIVASLPPTAPFAAGAALSIQPWVALLLAAALFVVVALLLRQSGAALPRMTLPAALRWCWWRALPFAVAGLIYVIIV